MQKLFNLLVAAITLIAALRKANAELRTQLGGTPTGEQSEEQAQRNEEFREELDQLDEDTETFALQLNDEPSVPRVNPETFEVTDEPRNSLQDLAMREHQKPSAPPIKEEKEKEEEAGGEEQTVDDLVNQYSKEELVELADKEGVPSDGNKTDIATAIVAKRQNK